jgi:hypothetical protein
MQATKKLSKTQRIFRIPASKATNFAPQRAFGALAA